MVDEKRMARLAELHAVAWNRDLIRAADAELMLSSFSKDEQDAARCLARMTRLQQILDKPGVDPERQRERAMEFDQQLGRLAGLVGLEHATAMVQIIKDAAASAPQGPAAGAPSAPKQE